MFSILIALLIAFTFTTFAGFWLHRLFHKPWIKFLYEPHRAHHDKLYPIESLTSDVYRSAGKDDSGIYFVLLFSPILIGLCVTGWFGILTWTVVISLLVGMIGTGYLHDLIHEKFHLTHSIWHRIPGFKKLQDLHFLHHYFISMNNGIFYFGWDRLFGTFKDTEK